MDSSLVEGGIESDSRTKRKRRKTKDVDQSWFRVPGGYGYAYCHSPGPLSKEAIIITNGDGNGNGWRKVSLDLRDESERDRERLERGRAREGQREGKRGRRREVSRRCTDEKSSHLRYAHPGTYAKDKSNRQIKTGATGLKRRNVEVEIREVGSRERSGDSRGCYRNTRGGRRKLFDDEEEEEKTRQQIKNRKVLEELCRMDEGGWDEVEGREMVVVGLGLDSGIGMMMQKKEEEEWIEYPSRIGFEGGRKACVRRRAVRGMESVDVIHWPIGGVEEKSTSTAINSDRTLPRTPPPTHPIPLRLPSSPPSHPHPTPYLTYKSHPSFLLFLLNSNTSPTLPSPSSVQLTTPPHLHPPPARRRSDGDLLRKRVLEWSMVLSGKVTGMKHRGEKEPRGGGGRRRVINQVGENEGGRGEDGRRGVARSVPVEVGRERLVEGWDRRMEKGFDLGYSMF